MKITCRLGFHELDWEDRVLRTHFGKAVQRGSCRYCGLIKQRYLTVDSFNSDSTTDDTSERATGPLPRIKL